MMKTLSIILLVLLLAYEVVLGGIFEDSTAIAIEGMYPFGNI